MLPWITVDRARSPDGTELVLARRGEGRSAEWVVRAGGQALMSSRVHGSEETLFKYALERVTDPTRILIGGLGLGYTLRVALTLLPAGVPVRVVELLPELVEWNRTHVADVAGRPLDDPRVVVEVADVHDVLQSARGSLDLVVLDVDNGPSALTQGGNARLYSEAGARKCAGALRDGGVLAVWSASEDARYRRNLESAGFSVEVKSVLVRAGSKARDVLFLARKGKGKAPPPEGSPRNRRPRGN
jgi:spermidine synthase